MKRNYNRKRRQIPPANRRGLAMPVIVAIFPIVTIWLTPKIFRALRWLIARLRGLFGSDPQESANR